MASILHGLDRRAVFGLVIILLATGPVRAADPIKVGLVAALSGQSAKSGEAITRGLGVAIDEINAAGGVLGRKIELVRRDDESNPAKGILAARELVQKEKVVAFFGGIDTPVSMAIVPFANSSKVPFMGVWAAGTPITRNGAPENYVFRVSAVDEHNDDLDMVPQLTRLKQDGADCIILVANVAPAAQMVKSLDRMSWDVPVVSHWGPAGGRFTELGGPRTEKVDMVQTYSFFGKLNPKGEKVLKELEAKYPEIKSAADVTPAVGVANAYDAMHLLALAITKAGSTDGPELRKGLYELGTYDGLIKNYSKPFSPENQDALSSSDYIFTHFVGGEIVPLK